jgi:hypothetical protein
LDKEFPTTLGITKIDTPAGFGVVESQSTFAYTPGPDTEVSAVVLDKILPYFYQPSLQKTSLEREIIRRRSTRIMSPSRDIRVAAKHPFPYLARTIKSFNIVHSDKSVFMDISSRSCQKVTKEYPCVREARGIICMSGMDQATNMEMMGDMSQRPVMRTRTVWL